MGTPDVIALKAVIRHGLHLFNRLKLGVASLDPKILFEPGTMEAFRGERYIGRMLRTPYLASPVFEARVMKRRASPISINEMIEVARLAWADQKGQVFHGIVVQVR